MHRKLALIALLLLALCIPAVSAIDFNNAYGYGVYPNPKYPDTHANNTWDGDPFTYAWYFTSPSTSQRTYIRYTFPENTTLEYCEFWPYDGSTLYINLNTSADHTFGPMVTGRWNRYDFPTPEYVGKTFTLRQTDANGITFQLNETRCFGWNTTYTDFPPEIPVAIYSCEGGDLGPGSTRGNPYDLTCVDGGSGGYPAFDRVNWTLTQPDTSTIKTGNASLIKTLTQNGWYGLDYEVCNTVGCGYSNTTTLVNVTSDYIPATGIHFWATNYDPVKNAVIKPSEIYLQNLTSLAWRNVSSTGGISEFDSTDFAGNELLSVGQTVKLCGYAPGYTEACYNVTLPYSGYEYRINLASTSALPTGTNATFFVNAISSKDASSIASATITVANTTIPYSKSALANAAGVATFANIDPGTYTITATKTGYQSATTSWHAPAGLVTTAYIGLQPIGATPVPTDTYGNPIYDTPAPTQTYAPGETHDTRTDEEKDADMMNLLRDQGPMLIQFFIVCFVIYMIMGIGKGR